MKDALKNLLVVLLGLVLNIVVSISVLQRGWGLEIQSWGWVIFGPLAAQIIVQSVLALTKESK